MNKSYKILIYLVGFFLALIVIFLIFNALTSPSAPNNSSQPTSATGAESNLPDYILNSAEETSLKEFVKNFVNLYNTYSYNDFSNLTALGDYQTESMQKDTLATVSSLQSSLKPGYSRQTRVKENTFTYSYPSLDKLTVQIKAQVAETPVIQGNQNNNLVTFSLDIKRQQNNGWLVNEIKILK